MSTKHIRTTAELVRFGASVKIDCRNCGLARTLEGPEFPRDCGTGSLGSIAKRLKCKGCGEKRAQLTVLPPV